MTAVETLMQEINKLTGLNIPMDEPCVQQAKKTEQQQIENAFESGDLFSSTWFDGINETSTNYYNENFKSK